MQADHRDQPSSPPGDSGSPAAVRSDWPQRMSVTARLHPELEACLGATCGGGDWGPIRARSPRRRGPEPCPWQRATGGACALVGGGCGQAPSHSAGSCRAATPAAATATASRLPVSLAWSAPLSPAGQPPSGPAAATAAQGSRGSTAAGLSAHSCMPQSAQQP